MNMPGRKYSVGSAGYRYGFNGKENDKDISEGGQDYGMRISDNRLGRFLSVDPITKEYPELTPYQFASNRPIDGIDVDGLEWGGILFGSNNSTWLEPLTSMSLAARVPATTFVRTNISRPTSGSSWVRWMLRGQKVHKEQLEKWELNEGFKIEQSIKGFGRMDGIKISTVGRRVIGTIRELKPDSKFGRSAGESQLIRYLQGAKQEFGNVTEWKLELYLYRSMVGIFYSVQEGDNLSSIANSFGISTDDLMKLNNINSKDADLIVVGENLLVGAGIKSSQNVNPKDNTNIVVKLKLTKEEIENAKKAREASKQKQKQKEAEAKRNELPGYT